MVTKNQHIKDIKKIMSVEDEMILLLPKLEDKLNLLNPWVKQLPGILRGLKLKKNQTVLDIPCGKGGVSIPLAKKYKVKVIGYDIIKGYIQNANELARKEKITRKCKFQVKDIRNIIKRKNICDVLLWIAPPHLWKNSKITIQSLRNCVKNKGLILIADAYAYKPTKKYEDYETLKSTNKGFAQFNDRIIKFYDYKSKLWKEDYNRARKSSKDAIKKIKNKKDKKTILKHIQSLNKDEKLDSKYLGLGIWIIEVKK